MIRAYADAEGIPYVDYHTPMAAADGSMNADYTKDGVHPTEAGYAVMERILPPVVKRVQADRGFVKDKDRVALSARHFARKL